MPNPNRFMEKEEMNRENNNIGVAEVKLTIDGYEDIFSEFDPRPLSERGLSGDFLFESDRAIMAKSVEKIDFLMLMPEKNRDLRKEKTIKDRLTKYFRKHHELIDREKKKIVKKGAIFTISGIILMLVATILFFKFRQEDFLTSFFTILLEPGGWFLFWEGLDLIIFESKEKVPNLKFYKRMANANIKFASV